MALRSKIKFNFVNGKIKKPRKDDQTFFDWDRCNIIISYWLMNSVSPSIRPSISRFKTAHAMWNDLQVRFFKTDFFRISDVQEEIYLLKQGDLNISDYYIKMRALWDEFDDLRPILECECAIKCECKALKMIFERQTVVPQDEPILAALSSAKPPKQPQSQLVGFPPNFKFTKNASSNLTVTAEPEIQQNASTISISQYEYESLKRQDMNSVKMIGSAEQRHGLYFVNLTDCFVYLRNSVYEKLSSVNVIAEQPREKFDIWHFRLDHPSSARLSSFKSINKNFKFNLDHVCDVCHYAKQRKLSFPISQSIFKSILTLFTWIYGPVIPSMQGHKYSLTIVDDFSRHTWIFFMKTKSETRNHITQFYQLILTQFDKRIKVIRSDNGQEFNDFQFYASHGILHQTSCVECPEQNGRVEKKHQHILNVGRALLFQSKLPLKLWGYAVSHAIHLVNRTPTPILNNKTPYEMLHNKIPDISHLRVFGSLCFISTLDMNKTKFTSRSSQCIRLGYQDGTKGYKVLHLNNHSIQLGYHVVFYEHIFSYDGPRVYLNDLCLILPARSRNLPVEDEYANNVEIESTDMLENADNNHPVVTESTIDVLPVDFNENEQPAHIIELVI
ncbi:uncharacterized protein [Rutidosis leptorrhynchoides]|uniref:uncharacterized protein n=1 Tax=Rutidosis leptorrhynchoides TaxID=125765 RepID=UPI003A990A6A